MITIIKMVFKQLTKLFMICGSNQIIDIWKNIALISLNFGI